MTRVTRRDFLGITSAMAAGFGMRLWTVAGCRCGAQLRAPHIFGKDNRSYCPNCGRDVAARQFDLKIEAHWDTAPSHGKLWDPAQVPFPNPLLIERSDKPLVLFSKIRLQGTPAVLDLLQSSAW